MENQSPKQQGILRRLVAALIVAIGAAIVWGVLVGWGASIVETWMRAGNTVYENIAVTRSGTPVIQSYSVADYENVTYRTLEGRPIEVKNNEQLNGAYLMQPVRPMRFFDWPLRGGQSLAASDFARPRGGWYLIHNRERPGRAYFAGYDEFSNMPIGYLARRGFRRGLPPIDDCFDVGLLQGYYKGAASVQYLQYDGPANQYEYDVVAKDQLPSWLVFVIDGDRLMEVDLQGRAVRQVFESPDLFAVGILTESKSPPAADEPESNESKTVSRVALRARDRIFVLDIASGAKREFPLPESLRQEPLSVYSIGTDQILLTWASYDDLSRQTQHLAWLGADGKFDRQESLQFAQAARAGASPRTSATMASGMAPIPLGWAAGIGIVGPLGMLNGNQEPTYAAALAKIMDVCWPALIIVTAIGCLSAWAVWRWQRKYFRPATGVWCTFAFLLGPPAVAAYWLEHRQAKLEPCGECQTAVPRDRDACASCATPFPAPPLVGTEIFA